MSTAAIDYQLPLFAPEKEAIQPFLRWPGGKRWLTRDYRYLFDGTIRGKYIEPFLGGGSVFAAVQPDRGILSDYNDDLVNLYRQIRDRGEYFRDEMQRLEKLHSREFYYQMRDSKPIEDLRRAVWLLYLNRTCFNGIYRVNGEGVFNVPIGTKTHLNLPADNFAGWARALNNVDILHADFEIVIARAGEGDLIYADPPYTISQTTNGFAEYNATPFSMSDQVRLRNSLAAARNRGARVVTTNAAHPTIVGLYKDSFHIVEVSRSNTIAATATNRGIYNEIIIHS